MSENFSLDSSVFVIFAAKLRKRNENDRGEAREF